MAILDKLLEKKDVLAYVEFRVRELQKDMEVKRYPAKQRQAIALQRKARIEELRRLACLVRSGAVKKQSIEAYMKTEAWKREG